MGENGKVDMHKETRYKTDITNTREALGYTPKGTMSKSKALTQLMLRVYSRGSA